MTTSTHRISLLQLHPLECDAAGNFANAEAAIRRAKAAGAELAVLPEYCLSAFNPRNPGWKTVGDDSEVWVKRFQDLARELDICIVPGSIIEKIPNKTRPNGKPVLENACYFIDNHGKILDRYVKKNLWYQERRHIVGGADNQEVPHRVIDTPLGKVGLLVCWDLAYPEPFRALIAQGAELIIVPSFWTLHLPPDLEAINPLGEAVYLDATIVARAYDNQVCVVFVNAGGPADQKFAGRTMVVMPGAGKVAEAKGPEVEEVLADVDLGVLKKAENHYRLRSDAVGGMEWWPYGGVMGCGRTSKI